MRAFPKIYSQGLAFKGRDFSAFTALFKNMWTLKFKARPIFESACKRRSIRNQGGRPFCFCFYLLQVLIFLFISSFFISFVWLFAFVFLELKNHGLVEQW